MSNLNGARVIRQNETLFIPLPPDLQRPIVGGCSCKHCKAHPDRAPTWDTLALGADRAVGADYAWTVHYPELQR